MKNKIYLIIIIIVSVIACGALAYASITIKNEQNELDKHLIRLDYNSLKEKIDNKESFILLISASDCNHCQAFKPTLKKVLKENNIYAYEIQNDTLNNTTEVAYLNSIATISGTPTTIFIENGVEKSTSSRIVGNAKQDKVETRLKAMGYIKEN